MVEFRIREVKNLYFLGLTRILNSRFIYALYSGLSTLK